MVGYWSYEVPEFTWDHFNVGHGFWLDKNELAAKGYDLIVYEDAKISGFFAGVAQIPVAYVVVDSTLSEDHYRHRRHEAHKNADLVLVDWDGLQRFKSERYHVARWSHCVNDRYFKPGPGKDIDIGSFQGPTQERREVNRWLADYAASRGLRFECGKRGWDDYARDMARSKVVINVNRSLSTRGHRMFDTMACRSCLVSSPAPAVPFEPRKPGRDYVQYRSYADLEHKLDNLLLNEEWAQYAEAGYKLVQRWHTWTVRARQLREILKATVGL